MCRNERISLIALCAVIAVSVGCIQEMANQPRYEPLEPSAAFADGRSSRQPVPGTVARGQLRLDEAFYTGRQGEQFIGELPERALANHTLSVLLERGRDRFGVYCSHCHGLVGGGTGGSREMEQFVGMVVKRGFPMPPTFHQARLRRVPIGHFFDVMTNGFGRMPAHGYMIPTEDRWAIAAYIRALQLSQHATGDELTPEDIQKLNAATSEPTANRTLQEVVR